MLQEKLQDDSLFPAKQENQDFPLPAGIRGADHILKDPLTTQQSQHNTQAVPRNNQPGDWPTILLLTCLVLFAWVRFFHTRRLKQIYQAFAGMHFTNQMTREGNLFHERLSIPLQTIALSSVSYFIYQIFQHFELLPKTIETDFKDYLIVFGLLTALWVVKLFAVRINGLLFKTTHSALAYNQNMLVYLIMTGLLLLPVIILQTYLPSQVFILAGMTLLGVMLLLWIIRAISIGLAETGFSVLHLFLYLCSFEFLPVLVLIKLIIETS